MPWQCIHYFGCKRAVSKQCYFSLSLHIFTGVVGKKYKKNSIYPTETFFKTQCLLLSMFDMYRSLALLSIMYMKNIFYKVFLTANYYADFYRSMFTAEDILMQYEYLTCVTCRMNCKLILSHLLHYQGVLVLKVRNYYYKYVHYMYAGVHFVIISICVE